MGRLLALDRNLAFAVSRGLSKRQAIHPIRQLRGKRHLATTVSLSSSTETTTLPNGFTIATDFSPYAQTATVGVWIDSGSRAETAKTNGTAHFLEHLTFKGTASRSQQQLELQIENLGAHLNAYTSREQTVYYAKALNQDVGQCVEIISDILQNSTLSPAAVDRERDVIVREQQEVDKQLEEVVFDHLHAVAFQGQALGRTILGPTENIMSINRGDLTSYINENYTAERMVLVGAGGVAHEQLVSMAEKHFGKVPSSPSPQSLGTPRSPTPRFIGSEVRLRDDTMPMAHIALAVEGVGWQHEDYWVMQVMQAIIGNWDRALGSAANLGSRLASFVSSNDLANSFMSFSTSYSDTGLWGIYLVSENLVQLDDLVHFTLKVGTLAYFNWLISGMGSIELERDCR